jgi:predicted kinase
LHESATGGSQFAAAASSRRRPVRGGGGWRVVAGGGGGGYGKGARRFGSAGHNPSMTGSVIVITGVMASGKSTVAQRLAERLPRSAHIRGDVFRRMIINGRAEPTPEHDGPADRRGAAGGDEAAAGSEASADGGEAKTQLRLRYHLSAATADAYAAAGFTAIVQDVILGPDLCAYEKLIRTRPCRLVVLCPRPEVVAGREAARRKTGYRDWTVEALDRELRATQHIGLWLDNSDQTPDETVEAILRYL